MYCDFDKMTIEERAEASYKIRAGHMRTEIVQYLKRHMSEDDFKEFAIKESEIRHAKYDECSWEDKYYVLGQYLLPFILPITIEFNHPIISKYKHEGKVRVNNVLSGEKEIHIKTKADVFDTGAIHRLDPYEIVHIGEGITEIGTTAAWNNPNLKEVYLPKTIKKIEKRSFLQCENLEKIYIANPACEIEEEGIFLCPKAKILFA